MKRKTTIPLSKSGRVRPLNGASEMHLLLGECLLVGCQICTGNASMSAPLPAYSLRPEARELWHHHRERLLEIWRDPEGPEPGASGFQAAGYRGRGRTGLPAWAEVKFEGVPFPPIDKAWPSEVKKSHRDIKAALK